MTNTDNLVASVLSWFFVSAAHFWTNFDLWGKRISIILAIIVSLITIIKWVVDHLKTDKK